MLSAKKKREGSLEWDKLELFSLKLFKLCIELLQKTDHGKEAESLVSIATLCMDALLVCSGSSAKAPPLSFEKILLHFAKWCLTLSSNSSTHTRIDLGVKVCRVLADRLNIVEDMKQERSAEIVNLQKLIYDILWKAGLQLEQKEEGGVGVARLCLEMRTVALESLISCGKFDLCAMLKSAMKVDLRYRRIATTSASNSTSCGCGQQDKGTTSSKSKVKHKQCETSHSALDVALEFHSALERKCNVSSLIIPSLSCREFSVGVGFLLQRTLLRLKSSHHRNEGVEGLGSTLDLCMRHGELCSEDGHVIVQAQANCLQLWNAIRDEDRTK